MLIQSIYWWGCMTSHVTQGNRKKKWQGSHRILLIHYYSERLLNFALDGCRISNSVLEWKWLFTIYLYMKVQVKKGIISTRIWINTKSYWIVNWRNINFCSRNKQKKLYSLLIRVQVQSNNWPKSLKNL